MSQLSFNRNSLHLSLRQTKMHQEYTHKAQVFTHYPSRNLKNEKKSCITFFWVYSCHLGSLKHLPICNQKTTIHTAQKKFHYSSTWQFGFWLRQVPVVQIFTSLIFQWFISCTKNWIAKCSWERLVLCLALSMQSTWPKSNSGEKHRNQRTGILHGNRRIQALGNATLVWFCRSHLNSRGCSR